MTAARNTGDTVGRIDGQNACAIGSASPTVTTATP